MAQTRPPQLDQQGDLAVNLISFQHFLKASNYSPRTQDTYSQSVIQFAKFIRTIGMPANVADIAREHVEHWITIFP